MIVGIGTDLVGVSRFAASLKRTPSLAARVFTAAEQVTPAGEPRRAESLAARFAAKEAAAKTLGAPRGCAFLDCEVLADAAGRPSLRITGRLAEAAAEHGVTTWHVSLTHDADTAVAVVIAERPDWPPHRE